MLRSLYSGISGMKNFQTKLDVIGNNIANVNTAGFKKGRITFQDMLSQTTSTGQGNTVDRGGINALQVGVGSQAGTVDNIQTQGFRQTTNNPLDLMLEGDGYFIVQDGAENYYTRAGNFYLDDEGYVVNADGYYLLDTAEARIQIADTVDSFSIQPNGTVILVTDNVPADGPQIGVATFNNPEGLEKAGNNLFVATDSSGVAVVDEGEMVSGALEMSNVDLAEEFSEMINAQRAFQANTRIITTSDQILEELVNLKR